LPSLMNVGSPSNASFSYENFRFVTKGLVLSSSLLPDGFSALLPAH
jgi:hypothetical protein